MKVYGEGQTEEEKQDFEQFYADEKERMEEEEEEADGWAAISLFPARCQFCSELFDAAHASTGKEGGCLSCHRARYAAA